MLLTAFLFACLAGRAQELYVFTEPASNMATKSIGIRLNNFIMPKTQFAQTSYYLVPEIMFGVSKRIMIHGDVFFSNRIRGFAANGGSVYAKYRFLSHDDVQQHFRMAAFGRYSFTHLPVYQQEINLYGMNSGVEGGIVATQLLHKVALSSGLSYVKAVDNGNDYKFPYGDKHSGAVNFTFSAGKLMLPKVYTDYRQTNLNLIFELLNQVNTGSGKYFIDAAPAVQLIFNSVARLDIGYRTQIKSTLLRTAPNSFFIRLEYNFFNAF